MTPAGSRLLSSRLAAPLSDPGAINARLDAVETLAGRHAAHGAAAGDAEVGARPDPRADAAGARSRRSARSAAPWRARCAAPGSWPALLRPLDDAAAGARRSSAASSLTAPETLAAELIRAVDDDAAAARARRRVHPHGLRRQARCRARAGLRDARRRRGAAGAAGRRDRRQALRIQHNSLLGYFVEVPAPQGLKLTEEPLEAALHPPPDHGQRHAVHHHGAGRARGPDRPGA